MDDDCKERKKLKLQRSYYKRLMVLMLGTILLILSIITISGQGCAPNIPFKTYSEFSIGPDPLYDYQWFVGGTAISSNLNIDATSVWNSGNLGQGINISILDPSSIFLNHSDLTENKDLTRSYNYLDPSRGTDTTLANGESHGTCAAGVVGARDNNGLGIRGVASRASISARTTSGVDADIYGAITYQVSTVDVLSNSYGPSDELGELNQYYTNDLFKSALAKGTMDGRSGMGSVFVWAAGNGRVIGDRSNFDGYASQPVVMSICSVGKQGSLSSFSEPGSNLWICAPGEGLATTDYKGLDCGSGPVSFSDFEDTNYTKTFTGTSAAAPVVAGVVGLILKEANDRGKNLGWRDVKMILAESATKPSSLIWQPTRIGFNDDMGFGIVNVASAISLVKNWIPVGNGGWLLKSLGTSYLPPTASTSLDDSGGTYLSMNTFVVDNNITEDGVSHFNSSITYLEFVTLELKLSHTDPGDLEISVSKTPIGGGSTVVSKISEVHSCRDLNGNLSSCTVASNYIYEFGIANFLGESAQGTWGLNIRDARANGATGSVVGWRLKLYGH